LLIAISIRDEEGCALFLVAAGRRVLCERKDFVIVEEEEAINHGAGENRCALPTKCFMTFVVLGYGATPIPRQHLPLWNIYLFAYIPP
jgi:hypothetical protein